MDFRDRTTRDAVADIAQLLAIAYQRYRRARRIERTHSDGEKRTTEELDGAR
jgi:hypothetical protein